MARPFCRFEVAIIYRKDLTEGLEVLDPDVDLDISPASVEEVERAAICLRRRDARRRDLFRGRLQDGCVCFVARAGSTLVGYDWIRWRPGVDDGDMIALAENEIYSFDLYVGEDWRGRKIAAALGTRAHLFLKKQGYATAYSRVSLMNRNSVKINRLCGWTPSGLVLRVRGSRRGGWPIVTLWGSSHPLTRLLRDFAQPTQGVGL
jgi:GNAT superfamily N-acetyltransferase